MGVLALWSAQCKTLPINMSRNIPEKVSADSPSTSPQLPRTILQGSELLKLKKNIRNLKNLPHGVRGSLQYSLGCSYLIFWHVYVKSRYQFTGQTTGICPFLSSSNTING